ncbi:SigB/SigF/SigG family RNA polymerase sigma factor [Alloactinosynnema sp. L-07]|uniref:SigB/SigF/SigG family RNA polymerase sigma factor n=1 Tax=Alloactinosynnema sp. L-07 TaxID=1653480 RepID=UPI0006B50C51|nr:SigB/SigF/SigG family RNA polymerase sigma factor [Alloactinosynnema sp. L-07]
MPITARAVETRSRSDYAHLEPLFGDLARLTPTDPRHAAVRAELVTGHRRVAEHIAARFRDRGVPQDDLTQVAMVGLINAVDRFDPARGSDFLSYAVPTIMGEVRRYFRDTAWALRVPRTLQDRYRTVSAAGVELTQELGRAPTPSELARHLDRPLRDVFEAIAAGQAYHTAQLDETPQPGRPDDALASVEVAQALRPLIARLSDRERRILGLRYVSDDTQTQIAERLGLSQMHVSRLLTRTLAKLREGLSD